MGLFDSLLGVFGGVGDALGDLCQYGWQQYAGNMGLDDEEANALMADLCTGNTNATIRLTNQRTEERNKLITELSARPKPGKFCDPKCWIDDERCQECLAQQQQFQEAFDELQRTERAASNQRAVGAGVGKKPTKCSLCGAPFMKGVSECPYCGTAYPEGAFSAELSYGSADEAKVAAHAQAQQVCLLYADLMKNTAQRLADSGEYSKLFKFTPDSLEAIWYKFAMTADQVKQGANQYDVSRSSYIAGVISGTFTSISETAYNERKRQEQQQREEQRQRAEQQQREREQQQQRELEARNESFQRQLNLISGSAPKYVGGPQDVGYCCGNCVYYMSHTNECAYSEFFHPKSASDYCNYHHSR